MIERQLLINLIGSLREDVVSQLERFCFEKIAEHSRAHDWDDATITYVSNHTHLVGKELYLRVIEFLVACAKPVPAGVDVRDVEVACRIIQKAIDRATGADQTSPEWPHRNVFWDKFIEEITQ